MKDAPKEEHVSAKDREKKKVKNFLRDRKNGPDLFSPPPKMIGKKGLRMSGQNFKMRRELKEFSKKLGVQTTELRNSESNIGLKCTLLGISTDENEKENKPTEEGKSVMSSARTRPMKR